MRWHVEDNTAATRALLEGDSGMLRAIELSPLSGVHSENGLIVHARRDNPWRAVRRTRRKTPRGAPGTQFMVGGTFPRGEEFPKGLAWVSPPRDGPILAVLGRTPLYGRRQGPEL